MGAIKLYEKDIHIMIHNYKQNYFLIKATDKLDKTIDDAFTHLTKIKTKIEHSFNLKLPPLLSLFYINNKRKIRDGKQYQREMEVKTQCLKYNNTIFIDTNQEFDTLGFNDVPRIQFKYIGVNIGTYNITFPPDFTGFGILYDFEEFPNKEFNYETEEKKIIISGTKCGEPIKIIEDKYIHAPGDLYDGDDNDYLLNIGPYEFTVQFYTGEVTLTVTGDFSNVSYYIKDKGYMGGNKRLKFSEVCLKHG
jgi:hypothetical protein